MRDPCVALLSDFGCRDAYVGVMKAVMARVAPAARLIDLTHEIAPGDIRQAAFRLWQALPYLPRGTVVLAVVDPGVGTTRRPVAIQCRGFSCVGPDNGVFTYLLEGRSEARAVEIKERSWRESRAAVASRHRASFPPSSTFHGRDIFAPAAGLLASGTMIQRLGPEATDLVTIPWPKLSYEPRGTWVRGEALLADRFGNMVTSIGRLVPMAQGIRLEPWVPSAGQPLQISADRLRVRLVDSNELTVVRTYGEVPEGEALAYIGSDGLLEVAVNRGSASDSLGLTAGGEILLLW